MKKSLLVILATFAMVAIVFVVDRLRAGDGSPPSYNGQPSYINSPTVGSATVAVSAWQPTVPHALAPSSDSRVQWEYNVVQSNAVMLSADQLNQLGNDGWEMCGIKQRGQGTAYYYFKREKLSGDAMVCGVPAAPSPTAPALPPGVMPPATPPKHQDTESVIKPIGSTGALPPVNAEVPSNDPPRKKRSAGSNY